MSGAGTYSVEARSLNIAGGVAGHDYWVLRGPDGRAFAELHGLATDRETGRSIPIGTDADKHSLRVHHLVHDREVAAAHGVAPTRESYIVDGQPHRTVLSTGREEVMARWDAAVAAREPLNELDLDYPNYGVNLLSPTVNSNSTYRTLGEVMAIPVVDFPRRIEPGLDNRMTTPEKIQELQTHGYPQVDAEEKASSQPVRGDVDAASLRRAELHALLDAAGLGDLTSIKGQLQAMRESSEGRAWLDAGKGALAKQDGVSVDAGHQVSGPERHPDAPPSLQEAPARSLV